MSYLDNYTNLLTTLEASSPEISINEANSGSIIKNGAIDYKQTSLNTLVPNQAIKSDNYVQSLSGWKIDGNGDAEFSNVVIRGTVYATVGEIGGWSISSGKLSSTTIEIDSDNERIQSSNFVSGTSGFRISADLIEANNIISRGSIIGSTFAKSTISSIGGQLLVAESDVLDEDMTALDSATVTMRGDSSFSVGDILVIRAFISGSIYEEWMRVTSVASAPVYSVTRDLVGTYSSNSNPAWKAGTTIVRQGNVSDSSVASGGWLRLNGSGTGSPNYSVIYRSGINYDDWIEACRFGNLNGFLGYTSDSYGVAIGDSSSSMKYDKDGGLVIIGDTKTIATFTAGETMAAGDAVSFLTDEKVYKSSGNLAPLSDTFIGFCEEDCAAGGDAFVSVFGINKRPDTSLAPGYTYLLSDSSSAGAASVAHGTDYAISGVDLSGKWQSFVTSSSPSEMAAYYFKITLLANTNGATWNLSFQIRAGRGTSGTLLGTGTIQITPYSSGDKTGTSTTPIILAPSTEYTIVFTSGSSVQHSYAICDDSATGAVDSNFGATTKMPLSVSRLTNTGVITRLTAYSTLAKKVGRAIANNKLLINANF